MKKFLAMMLVVMMVAAMFVACGEKEPETNGGENGGVAEVKGEVFDAGEVKVLVPEGWKAYQMDENTIQMGKGTGEILNPFSDSYLQIDYYDADTYMMEPDSSFYDDVEDIAAFELGGYTWNGFKAKSFGYAIITLWAEDGDDQFQVMVWPETGSKKISLDDSDFKAILESIAPSAAATATEAPEATAEAAQ